jgi:hypothetical protein
MVQAQDTLLQETLLPIEIMESRDQEKEVVRLQRNHFLSYPASFDDPSRLLLKFPGISTLNDQSNFIVYRGLPPHYSKWSLYGAEIINPNHLSNTGTISDRGSRSAGGVNMLSGQVIGRMNYTGPSSHLHMGDAMAGISDITFRRSYKDQYFINIGLIGLEAGMEKVSPKSNFMINYRYSTLGALSALGVDLGDEEIKYQDITSSWVLDDMWGGELTFYGGWGRSSNLHEALKDSTLVTEIKDLKYIRYDNKVGFLGLHFNREEKLKWTLNYSSKNEAWESRPEIPVDLPGSYIAQKSTLKESLLSSSFEFKTGIWSVHQLLNFRNASVSPLQKEGQLFSRLRLLAHLDLTSQLMLRVGNDVVYDTWSEAWTIEPGLFLGYENWSADVRLNSMSISPELYFYSDQQTLNRVKSLNFSLAYRGPVYVEGFYHLLYDVPFINEPGTFYSDLDNQDGPVEKGAFTTNDGYSYGISLGVDKSLSSSSKVKLNATLMNSKSHLPEGETFNNPYNFGHIMNVQWMKTFSISDDKYLQLSTAFHYRGGANTHSIDAQRSASEYRTIYDYTAPFAERLNPYSRLDLRVNYIIKGSSGKQVISLDIQNITNNLNDAYNYYDPYVEEVLLKQQLGVIPILSYRRLW